MAVVTTVDNGVVVIVVMSVAEGTFRIDKSTGVME